MVIERATARVLPVSPDGRVLLLQDQDPGRPGELRWGTIGGAPDPGETLPEAAVRELFEETGIAITPDRLTAAVHRDTHALSYNGIEYLGRSTFFGLALDADVPISFDHLEPLEVDNVFSAEWWRPDDLEADGGALVANLPAVMRSAIDVVLGGPNLPRRVTARVVPVCDTGEVLLLQELDPAVTDSARWGTVGGAVDAGESLERAAVREMREETGLEVDVAALSPAFHRTERVFSWNGVTHLGDSTFFALRLDRDVPISFDHLLSEEVDTVLQARWWRPEDLAGRTDLVWPDLDEIAAAAVRILASGGRS